MKKQSITERNNLSLKDTVYHGKKQSITERKCQHIQSGIFEFNNEADKYGVLK